jgi:hypothetical protein
VAYLETRELKTENDQLCEENANLKSQLARVSGKSRDHEAVETDSSTASDPDDSNVYSADMSRSTRDLTSKSSRNNLKSKRQDDSRSKISTQVDKEISRLEKERAEEALFSIEMPTKRASASKSARSGHSESKESRKQPNTSKQRVKRVMLEDVSSAVESTEQTKASSDAEDLTLLSVIDVSCWSARVFDFPQF